MAAVVVLLVAGVGFMGGGQAASLSLRLAATANPTTVYAGDVVDYTITVHNPAPEAAIGVSVANTLPTGFSYVAGSTQVLRNGVLISTQNPSIDGDKLTWTGLNVPSARTGSHYGMHTFVQDRCEGSYIRSQLDRVRELMGPGAFVKQLFYRITEQTTGPQPCWVDFVNAAYDRDLIPVVRLQGNYGGPNWIKPSAPTPGDYTAIAQAYARVVSGLPRRDGKPLYVEVWNEPNLDIEWSGAANPVEYAHFLVDVAAALRALGDPRIVILNGALSPGGNYNNLDFIDAMATVPGAMQAFDVWATHPYPGNRPPEHNIHDDPDLVYSILAIDSYLLELERLARNGRKDASVLLTETGYALGRSDFPHYPTIDEQNRADYISRALRDYWSQWPEVVGVCPYELVDPYGGWEVWDWMYPDGRHHQQYDTVAAMAKLPTVASGELVVRFRARTGDTTGTYTSQVAVASSNLGSVSLDSAAAVQVIPPPPTPTPTNTPTPTLTPTPTPTPVCYPSTLQNGGFEQDDGWEIPRTAYDAGYSQAQAHAGRRSMRVGIVDDPPVRSYSSAWQPFTMPTTAQSTRISFWYYPISQDVNHGRQYALLLDKDRQYLQSIMQVRSDEAQWKFYEHTVSGYAGETLWLQFGAFNDGEGGATAMYVDDVRVDVCGPEGFITPPPTHTPSPTRVTTIAPTATPWYVALPLIWKGPAQEPQALSAPLGAGDWPQRPEGLAEMPLSGLFGIAAGAEAVADQVRPLAVDSIRQRLLVVAGHSLLAVDVPTGRVLFATRLPGLAEAAAVDPDSGRAFVAVAERGEVYALDIQGKVLHVTEGLGRPTNLVCGDGRVYVGDSAEQRVIVLDEESCVIIAASTLSAAPYGLAYDPLARRLYVGQMGRARILALEAETLALQGGVALPGLGFPLDLALDESANRLYVAYALSPKYGALSVIDTTNLSLVATLSGNRQQPLNGVDSVQVDSQRGMVLVGQYAGLLVLDRDLAVHEQMAVARSQAPGSLVFDPMEGTLYMGSAKGQLWSWRGALERTKSP